MWAKPILCQRKFVKHVIDILNIGTFPLYCESALGSGGVNLGITEGECLDPNEGNIPYYV